MKLVLALALGLAAAPALEAKGKGPAWNLAAFDKAVALSGRNMKLTQEQFDVVQKRKPKMLAHIRDYLENHCGHADKAVLQAFATLPREYFQYHYEKGISLARGTYEDDAQPYAIGYGSALSDYLGQAYMTQLLQTKPNQVVLEIGTGSGYQCALLSRLVSKVYSIEIQKPLGEAVGKIFAPLGYSNVQSRPGDGFYGWPEVKGGFDRIIVTCAAAYVPPALLQQLKPGGLMVIPVGQPFKRGQILYVYRKDAAGKIHSRRKAPVYFVPMTGAIAQQGQGAPVNSAKPAEKPAERKED
jgi:protein-L-isoaspartate(D-aspartate) O-methyltransferase